MDASTTPANATPKKDQPEKYIRTFAGDMEILKKGGTPDLTPLTQPGSPPAVSPANTVPLPPVKSPTPPPSKPPQLSLKTYAGDFTDRIKETHASTATVLAAEQDSLHRAPREEIQKPSHMNLPYIVAGGVLLIIGVVGGYSAYTRYLTVSAPVMLAPSIATPIFVDEYEEVSGTGSVLLQAMRESINRPLAAGTVRLLYVASTTNAESVFSALPVSAPDVLLRNIHAGGSMAGVINVSGNQSPFFILSVLSYSNTFAGMLAWEPVMPLYLDDLYPPYPALQAPVIEVASTTATTTTKKTTTKNTASSTISTGSLQVVASPAPVPAIRFFDMTIANRDVRVYRDASDRTILVYGYWNTTTLVIARDAAAFTELIGRLATARTL